MATLLRPEHLRADSFDAAEVLVVSAAERDVHESDKRFVEQKLRQAHMEDSAVILPATSDIAPNDNLAEGVAGLGKRSKFALPLVIIGHRPPAAARPPAGALRGEVRRSGPVARQRMQPASWKTGAPKRKESIAFRYGWSWTFPERKSTRLQ